MGRTLKNTDRRIHARRVLTALAAGAALALTACTSAADVNTNAAGSDAVAAPTSKKIAFDYPFTSLALYSSLVDMMTERAEELGYTVVTTDDQASLDKQITNLNGLATSDVAAVVSFPMEPAAVTNIMTQMQGKGIKWVTYGTHIDGEDGSIDFAGEATARAQVEAFVAWAAENDVQSGTVLLTVFENDDLGRSRSVGMREAMAELAPQFTVVEQSAANSEDGLAAGRAELAKNPDLVGALGLNDDATLGLAQASKEFGKVPSDVFYLGGNDGSPQVLEMMQRGDSVIRSTIALDTAATGRALAEMPIELIEGTGPGTFVAKFELVTAGSPELEKLLGAAG